MTEKKNRPDLIRIHEVGSDALGSYLGNLNGKVVYRVPVFEPGKVMPIGFEWQPYKDYQLQIREKMVTGLRTAGFDVDDFPANQVEDLVTEVSREHILNPIRDRLDELAEKWDGKNRLHTIGKRMGWNVPQLHDRPDLESAYLSAAVHLILLTAVERAYHPVAVQRSVIIYDPKGGKGKSSTIKALCSVIDKTDPEEVESKYYGTITSVGCYSSNEIRDNIFEPRVGKFLTEISECDGLFVPRMETTLKNLVNDAKGTWRSSYGHGIETHPWSDALVGTTNRSDVFVDSNNRRWLVVDKSDVPDEYATVGDDGKSRVWLSRHPDLAEQLVAEAVVQYKCGVTQKSFFENPQIKDAIDLVNQDHVRLPDGVPEYLSLAKEMAIENGLYRSVPGHMVDDRFKYEYEVYGRFVTDRSWKAVCKKFAYQYGLCWKNVKYQYGKQDKSWQLLDKDEVEIRCFLPSSVSIQPV